MEGTTALGTRCLGSFVISRSTLVIGFMRMIQSGGGPIRAVVFDHPPTKLQEDNVFTGVCDSVHGEMGGYPKSHVWRGGVAPTTDIWWLSLETYSNLFT